MNSLNSDPNPSLNQNKFKYEIQNPYYQYYRIPSNSNISPDFTSLQNHYATNPLLATQFSFQYSDNQGLGDGMNTNNHSNVWSAAPINATLSTQSRNNQPANIDPNSTHFFSIPSHGPPQAAEQSLFYPYSYGATNNMFWTHQSMLEYKSTNQNYPLPPTDKPQSWSDTVINGQYPPSLSNSLNYKTTLSSIDQNNQILPINNNQVSYQKQFTQNGYPISQMDSNESDISTRVSNDNPHIGNVERNSLGKSDNPINQEKKFPAANNANNMNSQMDSLQTQLANDCSIQKDNSNFDANRVSSHNNNQQSYSPKSLSKHHTSPNIDRGENSGYWNQDSNQTSNSTSTKSYAKVAKLQFRNANCCNNISNSTSLNSSYYMNNGNSGNSGNSRPNYKSTVNGFATGHSRSNTNNNNWFNSTPSNGNAWNTTKSKWSQDNSRNSVNNLAIDSNVKSTWAAKASLTNAEENMRNAEFKMKEIQAQINPKRFEINFEKTRYFVIKSYSEDDVHRSIKYKIWCSTKEGNKRLNEAFQNAQKIGGHVLLFFSVNGSGHFCGIAEMTSTVDENIVTGVWCQEKWKGRFAVKWIYVKDVPNTQLRHISTKVKPQKPNSECTTEIKPITNLRDATELKSERTPGSSYKDDPGYQALRIIMECKSNMSIFDDFLHYEKREMGIES